MLLAYARIMDIEYDLAKNEVNKATHKLDM